MQKHSEKIHKSQSRLKSIKGKKEQQQASNFQFEDNRPESIQLRKQKGLANEFDRNNALQFVDNRANTKKQNNLQEISQAEIKAAQLQAMSEDKASSSTQVVKQPTTLLGALAATAVVAGIGYALHRRSGIAVELDLAPAQLANNRLEAAVLVRARGLKEGDWVDYQISWAQGAVPGFNGVVIVNPHLGQQIGQAGGWRTDRPPPGHLDPFNRIPANPRYVDQGDGTSNFQYIDEIIQHQNMAQGPPNQRRWWFRAIVRNSWGVPIKTSNTVMVQWP